MIQYILRLEGLGEKSWFYPLWKQKDGSWGIILTALTEGISYVGWAQPFLAVHCFLGDINYYKSLKYLVLNIPYVLRSLKDPMVFSEALLKTFIQANTGMAALNV